MCPCVLLMPLLHQLLRQAVKVAIGEGLDFLFDCTRIIFTFSLGQFLGIELFVKELLLPGRKDLRQGEFQRKFLMLGSHVLRFSILSVKVIFK